MYFFSCNGNWPDRKNFFPFRGLNSFLYTRLCEACDSHIQATLIIYMQLFIYFFCYLPPLVDVTLLSITSCWRTLLRSRESITLRRKELVRVKYMFPASTSNYSATPTHTTPIVVVLNVLIVQYTSEFYIVLI